MTVYTGKMFNYTRTSLLCENIASRDLHSNLHEHPHIFLGESSGVRNVPVHWCFFFFNRMEKEKGTQKIRSVWKDWLQMVLFNQLLCKFWVGLEMLTSTWDMRMKYCLIEM